MRFVAYPQLEQLELRTKTKIYNSSNGQLAFKNLKRLIFKRTNEEQEKALVDFFKGSDTEIIPN